MAVFLTNVCKFDKCGKVFASLSDLICHIEDAHIDFDQKVVEEKEKQRPHLIQMSYVLKYNNDVLNKGVEKEMKKSYTPSVSIEGSLNLNSASSSKRGCESDDEEIICCESEGSIDSYTIEDNVQEYVVPIETYNKVVSYSAESNKPYACLIPGCHKRYKNINGMKYHSKHGHTMCNKLKKDFTCFCGKNYKTMHGLRTHAMAHQNYVFDQKRTNHKESKSNKSKMFQEHMHSSSSAAKFFNKREKYEMGLNSCYKNDKKGMFVKHGSGYKNLDCAASSSSLFHVNNIYCYTSSYDPRYRPDNMNKKH